MRTVRNGCLAAAAAWAGIVLAGCAPQNVRQPQPQAMQASAPQAATAARQALYATAAQPAWQVRSNAIEAMGATLGADAGPAYVRALRDPEPPVQLAAALAIGDVGYGPARPHLREMAASPQTDPHARAGVIYALHRLGDDTYTSQLGELLFFGKPAGVRGCAAMVMGRMREPSAMAPLRRLQEMELDPAVQLAVMQSLSLLGDPLSTGKLMEKVRIGTHEEKMIAMETLGMTRNAGGRRLLEIAVIRADQHPDERIMAAEVLAMLGDNRGYDLLVQAARDPHGWILASYQTDQGLTQSQVYQSQVLAARSLGATRAPQAIAVLVPLLESPHAVVRVAAARSILQLASSPEDAPAALAGPAPPEPVAAAAGRPLQPTPEAPVLVRPLDPVLQMAPARD